MERDSLTTFPHFLFISSLSIHFLYQKLSNFVVKTLHTRCEKIILNQIRCEKALQVVPVCVVILG